MMKMTLINMNAEESKKKASSLKGKIRDYNLIKDIVSALRHLLHKKYLRIQGLFNHKSTKVKIQMDNEYHNLLPMQVHRQEV